MKRFNPVMLTAILGIITMSVVGYLLHTLNQDILMSKFEFLFALLLGVIIWWQDILIKYDTTDKEGR